MWVRKMGHAHENCAPCVLAGLVRIDGVSEETDADGTVTSLFEYFRQRDVRGFGMTVPTEGTSDLTKTTARCVPPAVYRGPAPEADQVDAHPVADEPRQALETPLGSDQACKPRS